MVRPRLLLVCLALLLVGCPEGPPPKKSESLASRITLATGNVQIKRGEKWEQAIAGLLLRHGEVVKVGAGDRALIQLDDGSRVFLRHGSEVTLAKSGLQLSAGEAWIDAPQADKDPARYRAGEVSVSAAGAGLDIKKTKDGAEVYVARGLAVVDAPGGRRELQAGEKAVIRGKEAPKVTGVAFWEDWTGGMPDRRLDPGLAGAASGKIYAIDPARKGTPPRELEIRAQSVRTVIRDGVARTTVDQRFFNPSSTPMEGYYWFTVPEGAAVDRFALDVSGTLMEGQMIERKQARATYEAAVRAAVDPALLEWVDGRTFRARIYPIPATGERRVVLSYQELLPTVDGRTHYVYPMGGSGTRIQEFSLEVDLGQDGEAMRLATTADARVEQGGRKVTVRRSGYRPQGDFLLEMSGQQTEPLRAMRVESSKNEAAYVLLRYTPDVNWDTLAKVPGRVVVAVDTSAGGDSAERQLRADVAEAILRALSTEDKFALVAVDLSPRVLYPKKGLAPADEANIGKALELLSGVRSGGATDVGTLFDVSLRRLHGAAQPAVVYIGDGRATVGELGGEALAGRVTRSFAGSAARLFTLAVGADADHALLGRLARIGGGRTFRVDLFEQAVQQALRFVGHLKTPTLTDLKLELGAGLDQVFSSATGKVTRGQEVTVLARTHHPLPAKVKVTGKLGTEDFAKDYPLKSRSGARYAYVPGLWARRYLAQLMGSDLAQNRGTIIRLGLDYALMTPFSSFLVLESEAAYRSYGITPRKRDPLWGLVPQAKLWEAAAAAPLALFGCSRDEAPVGAAQVEEKVEWLQRKAASEPSATSAPAKPAALPPPSPPGASAGAPPADPAPSERRRRLAAEVRKMGALKLMGVKQHRGAEGEPADEARAEPDDDGATVGAADRFAGLTASRDRSRDSQVELQTCSDLSRRGLAQRRAMWEARLARMDRVGQWLGLYRAAARACELPHWRDRKELLDLIQLRANTPAQVRALVRRLPDARSRAFVQRRLLRRAVSPALAGAVGDPVNWSIADAALSRLEDPAARLAELRTLCRQNPLSVGCALRLIRALVSAGKGSEALATALRTRQDGLATPELMQQIGDLLAEAGKVAEAKRAYSEIVEFSPDDPVARQLLGDIFLRHGWYDEAYRQYRTICEADPERPLSWLRLAAAAAGTGRVDEALRTERKVASGEGEPGPNDPRRWARFWSAARIARLMLSPPKGGESLRQSMERGLRRLQVITSPGVLLLVTWEDLGARPTVSLADNLPLSDRVDASPVGLQGMVLRPTGSSSLEFTVSRPASAAGRPLKLRVTAIVWDEKRLRMVDKQALLRGESLKLSVDLPAP